MASGARERERATGEEDDQGGAGPPARERKRLGSEMPEFVEPDRKSRAPRPHRWIGYGRPRLKASRRSDGVRAVKIEPGVLSFQKLQSIAATRSRSNGRRCACVLNWRGASGMGASHTIRIPRLRLIAR